VNLINRIVVTFALLTLIGAAVAVAALAWTIPADSIDGLRDAVNWLDDNDGDTEKVLLTAVCGLIALLAFIALLFEFAPAGGNSVRLTDVKAGEAQLTSTAIGQRVDEEVRQVPHVSEVRSVVRPRRKGVELFLDLHVDPQANLATVADEALEAAKRVLADKVHVELTQPPKVRMHYRELRLQRALHPRDPDADYRGPAAAATATAPALAAATPDAPAGVTEMAPASEVSPRQNGA
jgi:hypothetical protein